MSRPSAPRRNSARALRITVLASVLVAAPTAVLTGWGTPSWWALPLLALAAGLSEVAVAQLQFGRQRWALSLTEVALAWALAEQGGACTVAVAVTGLAVDQLLRRPVRLKAAFNLAQLGVSTALAAAAAALAGDLGGAPLVGAAAGMAVYFLVSHTLTGVAVATMTRRRLRSLWRSSAPVAAGSTAGNTALGLLVAYLTLQSPLGLLGAIVPLALIWSSYDQQNWRSAESRLFAELRRGQERAMGRSTDVSAKIVLTAAARLLGGADVEMVLVAADGPVRYAGDENGNPQRLRVDPDAFDEPWVIRALGARTVTSGVAEGRPFCSALLGSYDDPLAVLIARRPRGAGAFGRRETRLAQVLVRQAEPWLRAEASDRAPDRAASLPSGRQRRDEIAPAFAALRDSADRLARLAGAGGEIDDVLDELHLVERAVASLVGATALATEPPSAPAAGRPGADWTTDWTTTGVLR